MSEERVTNCRSSKRHVLQEHERKNDVEEASKKISKSEASSRVVKSQPSGGHFDNTIDGTVRRGSGSLLVPNIEGQEDESQINVSIRKPTNNYIASKNARKELKMDEQSDMMVKKQTPMTYGCVDGVNAEAKSIELQLSCERKKTIVNEMSSKPPEKVDDISEDNTIKDSFQGTTVQMLKSSNSTECSVHYELANLVKSMNDKLQRLEKQFEHMKKRLDRIDKQVWKSRNTKFNTKVIDTAKVNQPKNGTKKRKFGKIREQIHKENFPTDEKNVELREDASLNKRSGSQWGCYICKGAHYARMCPLR
eukprot:TRINITY_DN8758_c0_g2_i1.p1 TRINITY_DN8758_c0_g2~~TRINITY_DN8758_c0_g2_i1.p1  ORF type:complete len:307 (-),score=80.02 TRINITY_DN8758_c0_g2_i1:165-1085(-)